MASEIKVPTLGESVTEATVGSWLKKSGEAVKADEPLVELETDKVTVEVPAPHDGVLSEIKVAEGETVEIGTVLGALSEGNGAASSDDSGDTDEAQDQAKKTKSKTSKRDDKIQDEDGRSSNQGGATNASAGKPEDESASSSASNKRPPSPAARKALDEAGLEAGDVKGSGREGQILKEDVARALKKQGASKGSQSSGDQPKSQSQTNAPATQTQVFKPSDSMRLPSTANEAAREERVKMTRLRQTIAHRLKDAQNTAAILTTFNDADMTAIMDLRKQYKELFERRHGIKLGFMGFFVKACIQALREIPSINAEIDGNEIIYKNYYHIGVAVGTERGLVVPVLREAEHMTIAEIEANIADFGRRARDGKLSIEDMQGGTFTISNGGVYGSMLSTPILNAPQSGILGMHRIEQRPVVVDGEVVARPMMYLALSYDHRIVDGKEAVTFLVRVKECLEDPQRFMLEL